MKTIERCKCKQLLGELLGAATVTVIALFNLSMLSSNFQLLGSSGLLNTRLSSNIIAGAQYLVAFVVLNPASVGLFNPLVSLGSWAVMPTGYSFKECGFDMIAQLIGAYLGALFARILRNEWWTDPFTSMYAMESSANGRFAFFSVSLVGSFIIVLVSIRVGKHAAKGLGPLLIPLAYLVATLLGNQAMYCSFNPVINFAFTLTRSHVNYTNADSAGCLFNQWCGQLMGLICAMVAWRVTTSGDVRIVPPFRVVDSDRKAVSPITSVETVTISDIVAPDQSGDV
ncbi:MAG: hypothetical protein KVP17_000536 [Porospora cf. gigantea B]|uniref:uncharacterized protein n=1 Tax=Porospora cf. gigantea B TaxID=2853592 RepID=UPI003571C57A|nr:MAG: hypothetical protein KVP17_000536 [Porospora cf. gigantea B]